jgi:hypothetical protein
MTHVKSRDVLARSAQFVLNRIAKEETSLWSLVVSGGEFDSAVQRKNQKKLKKVPWWGLLFAPCLGIMRIAPRQFNANGEMF